MVTKQVRDGNSLSIICEWLGDRCSYNIIVEYTPGFFKDTYFERITFEQVKYLKTKISPKRLGDVKRFYDSIGEMRPADGYKMD